MNVIASFSGEYRWLSNFWPCEIVDTGGNVWPSVEHAYQAMKFRPDLGSNVVLQMRIRFAKTAAEAKKLGRSPGVREDWNKIKVSVMERILHRKFAPGSELAAKLVATGDARLIEGNTWHDNFWGSCSCYRCVCSPKGNFLGELLMKIRKDLQS